MNPGQSAKVPQPPKEAARHKIYILGAGCSVCGGYPVAADVPRGLREFAKALEGDPEAKHLHRCVVDAHRRMYAEDVQTVDQLAERLLPTNPQAVDEARLAMAAYLISLEWMASERASSNYYRFFDELFRYGNEESVTARIKATPCRVITYNYDRLFEQTFIKWIRRQNPGELGASEDEYHQNVRELLNMGIDHTKPDYSKRSNEFRLLKLHGGISQFNRDGDYGMDNLYPFRLGKRAPEPKDKDYFDENGVIKDNVTIIVPADKNPEQKSGGSSFGRYLIAADAEAQRLCKTASEIHIIGYSIQRIDYFSFKTMLRAAKDCKKIVVSNRPRERTRLLRCLSGLRQEVSGNWEEPEFREEDFFEDDILTGR